MREADANLPFPPLTPPNEIVGGVFGNPKHDQLREDFDTLKKDVDRLIDWCNKRRFSQG